MQIKENKYFFTREFKNVIINKRVGISTPCSIENNRTTDQEEVYRMKKYEIMYIVNASLEDGARQKLMDGLHKIITDHEGTIDKIDDWGVKEFAYEINHMTKGYYVVLSVSANNEGIKEFDRLANINSNIVRFMVIKTQDEE